MGRGARARPPDGMFGENLTTAGLDVDGRRRGAVARGLGGARGGRAADPVCDVRRVDGRAGLGAAVHRARATGAYLAVVEPRCRAGGCRWRWWAGRRTGSPCRGLPGVHGRRGAGGPGARGAGPRRRRPAALEPRHCYRTHSPPPADRSVPPSPIVVAGRASPSPPSTHGSLRGQASLARGRIRACPTRSAPRGVARSPGRRPPGRAVCAGGWRHTPNVARRTVAYRTASQPLVDGGTVGGRGRCARRPGVADRRCSRPAGPSRRRRPDAGDLASRHRAQHRDEGRDLLRCRVTVDDDRRGPDPSSGPAGRVVSGGGAVHSGMFPCFLGGSVSRLVLSARSALGDVHPGVRRA